MFKTFKLSFGEDILTLFRLATVLASISKIWPIFFQYSGHPEPVLSLCLTFLGESRKTRHIPIFDPGGIFHFPRGWKAFQRKHDNDNKAEWTSRQSYKDFYMYVHQYIRLKNIYTIVRWSTRFCCHCRAFSRMLFNPGGNVKFPGVNPLKIPMPVT